MFHRVAQATMVPVLGHSASNENAALLNYEVYSNNILVHTDGICNVLCVVAKLFLFGVKWFTSNIHFKTNSQLRSGY